MVAVSRFTMYRCLSPQEGTMVMGHSQVPLVPGSLLCVLSLGTAECVNEPCLLPCSWWPPGLQMGGSQNRHFQEICKEQQAWGVERRVGPCVVTCQAFQCPCCHR